MSNSAEYFLSIGPLMGDFIVARNPDPQSRLPYIVALPLATGILWLKAAERWPRASRVFCHPCDAIALQQLEILERVPVMSCVRLGAAIDLVLNRGLLKRSQFIFTSTRTGRPLIFWQTPQSAQSARPGARIPAGHLHGTEQIFIDSRERYGYSFKTQGISTERRALPVGDYAAIANGTIVAVVERKTIGDFATSLVDGSLPFAMTELAAMPAAAVAVEAEYTSLLRYTYTRAGLIPTLLARLLIRYPAVSINFLVSRKIAEEWTYRYLLAAYENANTLPLFQHVKDHIETNQPQCEEDHRATPTRSPKTPRRTKAKIAESGQ